MAILEKGKVLGMAFEGTRSRGKAIAQVKTAKGGVAYVAMKSGRPIVPVAVVGSEKNYSLA